MHLWDLILLATQGRTAQNTGSVKLWEVMAEAYGQTTLQSYIIAQIMYVIDTRHYSHCAELAVDNTSHLTVLFIIWYHHSGANPWWWLCL